MRTSKVLEPSAWDTIFAGKMKAGGEVIGNRQPKSRALIVSLYLVPVQACDSVLKNVWGKLQERSEIAYVLP